MAKNDQQEAFEKVLSASLARISDQVKFAEAKHAALLAFATAWAVAIANFLAKPKPLPSFSSLLPYAALFFLASGLVSLLSFLPRWKLDAFFSKDERLARESNLLFYGDIANHGIGDLLGLMASKYLPEGPDTATGGYLDDLATQIQVNSQIARRKYRMFTWSAALALIGMAVVAIPAASAFTAGFVSWFRSL